MKSAAKLFILALFLMLRPTHVTAQQSCGDGIGNFDVIDMHVHTFNLRYLPMTGILRSKRVPSPLAELIADILVSRTGVDSIDDTMLAAANSVESFNKRAIESSEELLARTKATLEGSPDYQKLVSQEPKLDSYILAVLSSEKRQVNAENTILLDEAPHEQEASLTEYFFRLEQEFGDEQENFAFNAALDSPDTTSKAQFKTALARFDFAEKVLGVVKTALNIPGTVYGFLRMLDILMMSEQRQFEFLFQREFCQVNIFVSHMMDLENVYNDIPQIVFEEQIQRLGDFSKKQNERLIFFGAYDPFRRDDAMTMVEKAVGAGAMGIKFYPPSGYRPSDTLIPSKPVWWKLGNRVLRKQWNSRYKKFDAGTINKQNEQFFSYMNDHRLVIFSHHSRGGFEAAKDYGLIFGRPGYWGKVLKKFPKLKLVIGHSGGGEGWFGDFEGSFSQQAYNLCVLYEYVYCDFGFSDEIFDRTKTTVFIENLNYLTQMPQATVQEKEQWLSREDLFKDGVGTAPWIYPIINKMVYGSDWMMVSRLKQQRDFISAFDTALSEVEIEDVAVFKERFFYQNAYDVLFKP